MKKGYVVYSEILFDEYGLVLDKNNSSGFPWVLKEEEFAPSTLFKKHEIRTIDDIDFIKLYCAKMKTYDLPININYVCDITSDFSNGKFLGYDYLSLDMDYSPIYEASLTEAFSEDFKLWTRDKLNENLYMDTLKDLDLFIKKREEIINNYCKENSILTHIIMTSKNKGNIEEYIKVKVYRVED